MSTSFMTQIKDGIKDRVTNSFLFPFLMYATFSNYKIPLSIAFQSTFEAKLMTIEASMLAPGFLASITWKPAAFSVLYNLSLPLITHAFVVFNDLVAHWANELRKYATKNPMVPRSELNDLLMEHAEKVKELEDTSTALRDEIRAIRRHNRQTMESLGVQFNRYRRNLVRYLASEPFNGPGRLTPFSDIDHVPEIMKNVEIPYSWCEILSAIRSSDGLQFGQLMDLDLRITIAHREEPIEMQSIIDAMMIAGLIKQENDSSAALFKIENKTHVNHILDEYQRKNR